MTQPLSILFVCMGNICRSPMAEGSFKDLAQKAGQIDQFIVDSAGTGAWHEGDLPDPRAIDTLARHHIDITDQRSRPIRSSDFEHFDLILAMDNRNVQDLGSKFSKEEMQKVHLFMEFTLGQNVEIPDPYYGSGDGFEMVYNMLLEGNTALLAKLVSR